MTDAKYTRRIANALIYRYMYQLDPLKIMGILDKKGLLREKKNEFKTNVNNKSGSTNNINSLSTNSI